MKNVSTTVRKSLSLLIVAIILCSAIAVPTFAEYIFTEAPKITNKTDVQIVVNLASSENTNNFEFCAYPVKTPENSEEPVKPEADVITPILAAATTKWAGSTSNLISTATLNTDYSGSAIGAGKWYFIYARAKNTTTGIITPASPDFCTAVKTLTSAPKAPLATEIKYVSATYTSVTFEIQPSGIEYSTDLDTWTAVGDGGVNIAISKDKYGKPLTHTTEYSFYFRFIAAEGQAKGTLESGTVLAIKASTKEMDPQPKPAKPTQSDESLREDTYFSVPYLANHTYLLYKDGKVIANIKEGKTLKDTKIGYIIMPIYDRQEIVFVGLEPASTYTVSCIHNADATHRASVESDKSAVIHTKRVPAIPAAPSTSNVTDTMIEFNYTAGIEYTLIPSATPVATPSDIPAANWVKATEKADGTHTNAFMDKLLPGTSYSAYARVYATSENVASAVTAPITIITKESAKPAPTDAEIIVVDKSTTTIILKEAAGLEFRIGVTGPNIVFGNWQSSGKFANLSKNTNYTIEARYTFNPATQMASKTISKTILTSPRETYKARLDKTSLKYTSEKATIRGTDKITVVTTGDAYLANTTSIIMGDTRLVPKGWYLSNDPLVIHLFDDTTMIQRTFVFDAPSFPSTTTITLYVRYESQRWMGVEKGWQPVVDDEGKSVYVDDSVNITVEKPRTTATTLADYFAAFLSIFTKTIPALFNMILKLF